MKYWLVAAGAALFVTACATTDNSAIESAHFAAAPAEEIEIAEREGYDPNAIRCERERVLGSRLPAREVCRPEWEWRAIRRGTEEVSDHLRYMPTPVQEN